jgi:hypothetical protein
MLSDHQMPDLGNLNLDCDDADLLLRVCYALEALAEYAFHRSLAVVTPCCG